MMKYSPLRRDMVAALFFLTAAVICTFGDYSTQDLLSEIAVFAIFAMSVDFIVGYVGMVTLGHALYLATGAYTTAVLTIMLGVWPSAAILCAVLLSAVVAALTGALAVRTGGVFFIMITLAFGQMGYSFVHGSNALGGIAGLSGVQVLDLNAIGADLGRPSQFTMFSIACCAIVYGVLGRIVDSPYGHVLASIHQNERRARALGIPVARFKFSAFVVSGAVAGFAGALAAQRTQFVSPELAIWTTSGDALIFAIVGGLGTLVGPIAGTAVWVLLRHALSTMTSYWLMLMGALFIVIILYFRGGLVSIVYDRAGRRDA